MDKFKLLLLPALLKLARLALVAVGTSISTFLVARHLITAGDQATFLALCGDAAPALIGALPGAALSFWVWLNSFDGVVKVETALHLPSTGKITPATIKAASDAKETARYAETMVAVAKPPASSPQ